MSGDESLTQFGLLVACEDGPPDEVGKLAHAVLDDILYNIVHDIVLRTHREEKMARASTAAIIVEQRVEEAAAVQWEDIMDTGEDPAIVKTEAALYNHGEVTLSGNPLKDVHEIRCLKCGLPRLLYPTDGKGAKKPEPGVEYCKKRPFIDKQFFDIYGQTFVPEGPGRGKKRKDMVNPLKVQTTKEGTPNGSQDSPGTSPPPSEGLIKPIPFPHAKCHNCNTFLPIKRMNNHMVKCIGGGGRDSSRTALLKIQNGNGNGSQSGTTPPGSRNGTPIPGAASKRGSPNKREADEEFDSESSPQKKKKIKKSAMTKLKAATIAKSSSQISSSNLSFEQKVSNSDEEDVEMDDDEDDADFGTVVVEPKKKLKSVVVRKGKDNQADKKRLLHGKGSGKLNIPPTATSDVTKIKVKVKRAEGGERESESSQTLSSPN